MPLIHSKSNKAFKKNVETEMKANPGKSNRSQNLAIAYSIKRKGKAYGGNVYGEDMSAEDNQSVKDCEACSMAEGGQCSAHMSQGGMAENEGPKPDHSSKDLMPHKSPMKQNMDKQKYAEGGMVNAMKPLEQDPDNDNLELDEQAAPSDSSHIDPGISSMEDSDMERDLPRVSKALSLAADIMEDRRRRKMAEGGRVEADEMATGDGKSMDVGSLDDGIDPPTMSNLSNNSDEDDVNPEDGRQTRGMNISVPHTMSDDEHDESNASSQDEHGSDDSLIAQILKDRKMRRRG